MTTPNHPPATAPAPILPLRARQCAAEPIATALPHVYLFTRLSESEGASTQVAAVRN